MDFLKNIPTNRLIIILVGGAIALATIFFLVFALSKPTMVPLYSKLNAEDTNAITMRLQSMNIPYSSDQNGEKIIVPESDSLRLRMMLAQEGLPSGNNMVGYEIFDRTDLIGTSQFVNNINLVRALEGEIARTISQISAVESARVHLVLPKSELFSKSGPAPSASVMLRLKTGKELEKREVNGITHLVLKAVPNLDISNISIIDHKGRALHTDSENDSETILNPGMLEYQLKVQSKLESIIENLLTKYVGANRVKASVTADIDFDKAVISSEDYDPNKQVVRSERSMDEEDRENQALNNVSVANNIPNAAQKKAQESIPLKTHSKSDSVTNYEISKVTTNKVIQWGKVMKLSVAVIVDGVYIEDPKGRKIYQERSKEELTKLRNIVAAGIGIDEARGDQIDLVSLQFAQSDTEPSTLGQFNPFDNGATTIKTITVIIALIIAGFLLLRPLISRFIPKKLQNLSPNLTPDLQQKLADANVDSQTNNINFEDNQMTEQKDSNDLGRNTRVDGSSDQSKINDSLGTSRKYNELLRYLRETISNDVSSAMTVVSNWIHSANNK